MIAWTALWHTVVFAAYMVIACFIFVVGWDLAKWILNNFRAHPYSQQPPAARSVVPFPSSVAKGQGSDMADRTRQHVLKHMQREGRFN